MKKVSPQHIINIEEEFVSIDEKDVKKYLSRLKIKEKPTIVFWGSDSFVVQVLQALENNFEVKAVVTTRNSAVAEYFKGPIFTPDKLDSDFMTYHLSLITCDLFIVASYGKIIPQSFLDIPRHGALNIHPSLLPKFRGPSPVPATILSGETETGVTIIKMDEQMDHGPIVATKKLDLSGKEILPELIIKLFSIGTELLIEILPDFVAGKSHLKQQDHKRATYSKIMKKEDGYFDLPAGRQVLSPQFLEDLDRKIRAYYPWPGAWTFWEVQSAKGKVKRVVKLLPDGLIQMEGKKPQTMQGFKNSYPDFPHLDLILRG